MNFQPALLLIPIFIFGMCIGSFLNVCIYRIPRNKSIVYPGSFCPACKQKIPFYLNIPVISYLLIKGRCSNCKTRISARYPVVEILTGAVAIFTVMKFGPTPEAVFWFVFISVLITVSFIDFDLQIIPDIISIPGIFIFSLSIFIVPEMTLTNAVLGILSGGGSLYLVAMSYYLLKKEEGMGGGDIKLLAMIGAATGWQGVLFIIFTASLIGTGAGIFMMITTKFNNTKLRIPFGPFLSAGTILYIFYGRILIEWYFHII